MRVLEHRAIGFSLWVACSLCSQARRADAQTVDTTAAIQGLRDLADACQVDGSRRWGISLCGPTILVDRATSISITNAGDSARTFQPLTGHDGFYAGILPPSEGVANTSIDFRGKRWAMIVLPLPEDRYQRIKLLVHESFHRVQPGLGLWGLDPMSPALDEREGRVWLRLELHALARALTASDEMARGSVRDALLFRAYRHSLYPGADTLEAALERQEGLAEYTGAVVALATTGEGPDRVVRDMVAFERRSSYVRSFAYGTGPALGLLLDRFRPGWRGALRARPDMAALLAEAVRFASPAPAIIAQRASARAQEYGGAAVSSEEDGRDRERRARLADFRARLIDGPLLILTQRGIGRVFDPNGMVPLDDQGTVYIEASFTAEWGKLMVTKGALLSADFRRLTVPAPTDVDRRPLQGNGWTLELADGWDLHPSTTRAGDWEVSRTRQ